MRVFDLRKALAFGALLLASTLAVQAIVPKGAASVKDVAFTPDGDSLEARITTSAPASFTYFELTGPRRLVLDFRDLQNGLSFKEKQIASAGVERIRAAAFHSKDRDSARIVFDLTRDAQYQILGDKSNLVRVVFGKVPTLVPATLMAVEAPSSLLLAPVIVPTTLQALPIISSPQLSQAPQAPQGLMLASAMPAGPLQAQINVAPQSVPGSSLSTPAVPTQFTGELVTFEVRDLELKDFFRLIGEVSGLNIMLDSNVNGSLPLLQLKEVPWDRALDVVLKQNHLSGVIDGNVLRIATDTTLQGEEAARQALIDAKEASTPLETHTYILNYTKVGAVATNLNTSLSKRGVVVRDERKNALIITDIPTQFSKIDQLIKFMDTPAQQVEIEGRLLSANKSFSRDLGTQIGLLAGNRNIITGGTGNVSPTGLPLVTDFAAASTTGLAFLLQPGSNIFLDSILTMAEASGKAKLLSAPRITTQNNQAATVSQGTQIPVQSNVNNTVVISFITFALKLTVTPQITAAGTILLTVSIENSVPDFARTVNGIPSVATQQAQTQILIPDGGTAVIGGIYVDTDSVNVKQVPGLGSIPIIGHLFKETATIKSTSELIFFVTPKIKSMDQVVSTVVDIPAAPAR